MLHKLLDIHTLTPSFFRNATQKPLPPPAPVEEGSLTVKIIHVGGIVECYYMAVPTIKIMEKYPSFLLARPSIFRRPWDSLVRLEEILTPGEKFFVVPRRTVRKLRRRIRQQPTEEFSMKFFGAPSTNDTPSSDMLILGKNKDSGASCSSSMVVKDKFTLTPTKEKGKIEGNPAENRRRRRARNVVVWQPTLTSISEADG